MHLYFQPMQMTNLIISYINGSPRESIISIDPRITMSKSKALIGISKALLRLACFLRITYIYIYNISIVRREDYSLVNRPFSPEQLLAVSAALYMQLRSITFRKWA